MSSSGEFVRATRGEPGTRDRILEIYGAFIRDRGGWISVAALVELLGAFDIAPASTRAALARMKRRGEIASETRDGRRGYVLTPATDEWLRDGTPRILARETHAAVASWTLASFSVPEHDRNVRYLIRTRLAALGFGQVAGGLMIAPSTIRDEAEHALRRADLHRYVALWDAVHVGFGSIDDVIAGAWELDALRAAYRDYLEVADRLRRLAPRADDRQAFVRYLTNINAWRELPFLDPGLPLDQLPARWPSRRARDRFVELADRFHPGAARHVAAVTTE